MDISGNIVMSNSHGKMIGWRDDKPWTECSIDQLKSL